MKGDPSPHDLEIAYRGLAVTKVQHAVKLAEPYCPLSLLSNDFAALVPLHRAATVLANTVLAKQ